MPGPTTTDPVGRLNRAALRARSGTVATPPVRIVHLGLGAFHRAHQAWFTQAAADADDWGIAAFTGRTPQAADALAGQEGLYTLLERSAGGDEATIISTVVEARDGADLDRLVELLAAPTTAVVTLTVTEAGYRLTPDGRPDVDDGAVADDIAWLRRVLPGDALPAIGAGGPVTTLGRLLLGLDARRRAGAGGLAVVSCDNMPDNGPLVARGLIALAELTSPETARWIADTIAFVSTSVDRITPRTQPEDLATATALTGWRDAAPVVTEPFRDWVLCGEFPAGRPAWETAGAHFVDDIGPFEARKLWLLNGSHTLMSCVGLLAGHVTVAGVITDPRCRRWVEEYWDEAAQALPSSGLDLADYRAALLERFENPRIEHRLSQIAINGATKVRVRVVPIVSSERRQGRSGTAALRALAAWVALVMAGAAPEDGEAVGVAAAAARPAGEAVAALVRLVGPDLADQPEVMDLVHAHLAELTAAAAPLQETRSR